MNALLRHVSRLVEMEVITGNKCRQDDGKFSACSEGELKDMRKELKRIAKHSNANMCKEDPKFCEGNLGLIRDEMPQLDGPVLAAFIAQLKKEGIRVTHEEVDVSTLKSTQNEINTVDAADKGISFLKGKFKRIKDAIVASRELNIVDGHHRWAGLALVARVSKGRQTMKIMRVHMPIKTLIKRAKGFKGVARRAFGEARELILRAMMKG